MTDRPEASVQAPDGTVLYLPTSPGLAPEITKENAREMQQRSTAKKQANREEAERNQRLITAAARSVRLVLPDRAELAGMAEAIVLKMATMILTGEVPIRSAAEATNVARAWHEIVSLEQGTPTEIHEMRDLSKLADRFAELRETVAERRGTTMPATATEEQHP